MSRKNPYVADPRTRAAKARGYPARSVFKLEEIDRRLGLFRNVRCVLDLGAAPGSWTLYAAERVGREGKVLAVDLAPIAQSFPSQVEVILGDALALSNQALGQFAPYDLILSDMAPKTCGQKAIDQAQSFELFERAVEVAVTHGRPGSSFVGKLFMSDSFTTARARLRERYEQVSVLRPEGTRRVSSELFLVGQKRRA